MVWIQCDLHYILLRYIFSVFYFMKYAYVFVCLSHSVSLEDIEAVRTGRQTEGLRKYTEESVEGRAFSILFKGRQKTLDLIASSEEEAKKWVNGLEKVISKMNNLTPQKKTEQYPFQTRVVLRCNSSIILSNLSLIVLTLVL